MLTADQVTTGTNLPPLDVDVSTTTVVLGALASRDWRPMHHDQRFAVERNGTKDIFLNTPHQAGYFSRYVTDWTGPRGRIGRMAFRMVDSVFPGDVMRITGTVGATATDLRGCRWADIEVALRVGDRLCTTCQVRVALPVDADDNPWRRSGEDWLPDFDREA